MSIRITAAQAAALAALAEECAPFELHQVGGDEDVLVAWQGSREPDLLVSPDGTTHPVES